MIRISSTDDNIPVCVFVSLTLLFLLSLSTLILATLNIISSDKTKNWVIGTLALVYILAYFYVLCYYSIKFFTRSNRISKGNMNLNYTIEGQIEGDKSDKSNIMQDQIEGEQNV